MTKTARKNRETVAFSFRHFGNSPGQFQRQKRKKQSKRIEMKRAGLKKNNLAMVRDNSKGKTRRNSQNDEQIRNKTGFNKKMAMVRDNSKGKTRRNSQNDEQIRNKTGFKKNEDETEKNGKVKRAESPVRRSLRLT